MTAEIWPDHARGKGAGLMQCGLGIGFFLASFVWLFVGAIGPGAWRYMYVIGVLPALLTLWIRTGIPESQLYGSAADERRKAARRAPAAPVRRSRTEEQALTRFTFVDLFVEPDASAADRDRVSGAR